MSTETWLGEYRDPRELKPHPDNPRESIDEGDLEFLNLCADIADKNILQPIVITPDDHILIGHRRTRAAIKVELEKVPVIVREIRLEYAEEIFLAENMQRQNLSPLEEARAIFNLRAKIEQQTGRKLPLTDLARRTNLPTNTVSLRLCILDLPADVQKLYHNLDIPLNSARELVKMKDYPEACQEMADRLVTRSVTLNSLGTIVSRKLDDLGRKETSAPVDRTTKRVHQDQEIGSRVVLDRASVMDSLSRNTRRSISMFNVKLVMDSTCCSCGLLGVDDVCKTCPLPKFVNGLIGRADGGADE